MPASSVSFALVGCGAIAGKHIEALSRIDQGRIAAVCDINAQAAKCLGDRLGVPWFTDPGEMAQAVPFDVFTILTPSGAHGENVIELARFGRHFVVEKPIALRLDEADRMIAACDAAGVKLFVVKQNRFNPPVVALKRAIDEGRFGRMVMGTVRVRWSRDAAYYTSKPWRGTWQQDGGVLMNQASHHIDMLLWLMGDVESVSAMSATRLAPIEAEDTAAALLRFSSGALGIVEATTATRPADLEGSLSVLGEYGSVEIGGFFMNRLQTWAFSTLDPSDQMIREQQASVPAIPAWNHEQYLRAVIDAVHSDRLGLVDGLAGRRALELTTAIYEAIETGREVSLRFRPKRCRVGFVP